MLAGWPAKAQELTEQTNLAFLGTETQAFANMNGGGFFAAMDFHHCYVMLCLWVFVQLPSQNYHNQPWLHLVGHACMPLLDPPVKMIDKHRHF